MLFILFNISCLKISDFVIPRIEPNTDDIHFSNVSFLTIRVIILPRIEHNSNVIHFVYCSNKIPYHSKN